MQRTVVFLLFISTLFSCSKGDDTSSYNSIEGAWQLENAYCFCYFDDDRNFNEDRLIFNRSKESVTLYSPVEYPFINANGVYSYSISGEILSIENTVDFKFSMEANVLTLIKIDDPEVADDELTLVYSRK
jgi:hypothetical protein